VIQSIGDCANIAHEEAERRGGSFAEAIGCTEQNSMAACLRGKTPAEIITAQATTSLAWRPVQGGAAQPMLAPAAFESGVFNRVPVIIGNTRHETRAFVYEGNDLIRQPLSSAGFEAAVRKRFGDKADRVLAAYPVVAEAAPGAVLAAVQTDAGFACNATPVIDALSKWVATYAYEFRDESSPPRPYMTVPSSFKIAAGHTSDVPYVWQSETASPLTETQMALSRIMLAFWSQFAGAGDPNAAGLPAWPRYDPETRPRIGFLEGGKTEMISGDGYSREHNCGLWDQLH
jgi:para-nitrobenzyl esterase